MAGRRFQYTGKQTPGNNTPASFTAKIASAVIRACANTGILPSVVIGQAIKESGSGNDYKAFVYNNPFGHMALASWSGDGVRLSTKKGAPYWRVYPNVYEGIKAHINNLQQGKYKLQGVALKKTPLAQLKALQAAGYNVGPDKNVYANKVAGIIDSYNLENYDRELMAYERNINDNNLAFHEQDGITKALHNIFA
ncbi:Mannosyl-glycoprotein endo-beta-N-acetylglucosamidase [Pseudopedobacter saltans DSM 12145]|uniref:Mannosyl-glycoprotein endo-beta-N-acetylglucosamidase n=1 Tax=Pseudopedobacter saltans (strain ATCC 51119 / DSM 12145 / JCM 21818 / CCUG 39354 / LMG 10337 / NBRC 100064 / NCIMB 13643) TaxID=762903 RepID=F0S9T4_PSESL|nr:glucosaminidase domain-containing protein [Pseudopedobacter saltans]ADY51440.1 Mannosyl-glycoprotein endo-beta-N-acetylglucosamidase [Pseudopedobacter saltans DSM 12145]